MKSPGKWRVKESASDESIIFHSEYRSTLKDSQDQLNLHYIMEAKPKKDFIHTIEKIFWCFVIAFIAFILVFSS